MGRLTAIVLGAAAGGGYPQWNCRCPVCRLAWEGDGRVKFCTQASLAVSADGANWALLNASPDLRAQLTAAPALHPRDGLRHSPIAAVVLAVKPQIAPEVVPALAPFVGTSTVVVSIMAGRTLAFLADSLPRAALVRAMPNTPAAIARAITVAVPNRAVSSDQRQLVHALMSAIGAVEWISDETLMDAVTAV